jgi:hypothetical protein
MNKVLGLAVFWLVADVAANHLSHDAAGVLGLVVLVVVLTGLGSVVLSAIFKDNSSHLFDGFMLAFPGWLLTEFIFHLHLRNPASCEASASVSLAQRCTFGGLLVTMFANLCIVGIGMVIVAVPVLPLLWKLQKGK